MNEPLKEDDKRIRYVSENDALVAPEGIVCHYKNRWWLVHPTKGLLFFRGTVPQCNFNKAVTEKMHWIAPWSVIKFYESVFVKVNPHDYA